MRARTRHQIPPLFPGRSRRMALTVSFRIDELVRRRLATLKDPREVIADPNALYSGARITDKTLVPGKNARLGETRFETWLTQPAAQIPSAHPKPNAA
jgi:hypothetical protein